METSGSAGFVAPAHARGATRGLPWRRILPLLLGAFVVLPMAMHAFWGVTASTVLTDSMQPSFSAGDLVLTRPVPATDLEVGHIAVLRVEDGLRAHRILEVLPGEASITLVTRGDANELVDLPIAVTSSARVPVVLWRIPGVGRVAQLFARPAVSTTGLALLLVANALAVALVLFPRSRRERGR